MRQVVQQLLRQQDERICIHDFRMVRGQGHSNLIFDAELPPEMMGNKAQIKNRLDADIAAAEPGTYYTVITFDMGV